MVADSRLGTTMSSSVSTTALLAAQASETDGPDSIEIKAFEGPLSVARRAHGDTRVRARRVVVRDDFVRTGLHVAT